MGKVSYVNFDELFRKNGFYTTDEDGNEVLDGEKVKSEIGISESSAQGLIEGYYNPLRGKNYNSIVNYFELDVAQVRAFLRWRSDKWSEWADAGYPEEGPTAEFSDEDYDGEYYDEELSALQPEEEEEYEEEDFEDEDDDEVDEEFVL